MDRFLPALILFSNLLYVVKAQTDFQTLTSDGNTTRINFVRNSIVPRHYDIDLTFTMNVFADRLLVSGESNITFVVSSETQIIKLHYVGRITKIILFKENGTQLFDSFNPYNLYDEGNLFIITFPDIILVGRYTLYINYLTLSPESVFAASYLRKAISKSWFIYTNFKPYGARYLFPCWDEVGIKATFSLTIKHDKTYTALSNTNWQRVEQRDEITTTQFRKTNKICITDVTIILYPAEVLEKSFVQRIHAIAYYRIDRMPQLSFAFDKLIDTKSYLSSYTYFDIDLDLQYVILPGIHTESILSSKFIIFRENAILCNKICDSVAQKLQIMSLITRTYVNSWFQRKVNPSSSKDIWLNEALGAFFQMQIKIEPDLPSVFQVQANHESLHIDRHNFLMSIASHTYDSFQKTFLSSIKAPAILFMLEHILTPPVFREGILKYLQTHKSKQASSDHLWDAMKTALDNSTVIHTDYDLRAMMYSWIRGPNYPILEVRRNSIYEIVISRQVMGDEHATNQTWWIPITYTLRTKFNFSNTVPRAWLTPQRSEIILDPIRKTDWIIVNIQQKGYYRINYEAWNWNLLANELNSPQYTNIHVLNRAKLIDDAYYFMMTGQLDYNIFLKLTSYLSRELDYIAWYPMFKILEYLSMYFPFPESSFLKVHFRTILDLLFLTIEVNERDDKNSSAQLLRQELSKWTCLLDSTLCKYLAHNDLKLLLKNPENHTY